MMRFQFPLWPAALAAVVLLSAAGCSKDDPAEFVRKGQAAMADKRPAEAIIEFRRALQIDARSGDARLGLADAYATTNDQVNALREYVRAADLLPDNLDLQIKAGNYLLLAQQFQDAQARADAVLARDPKHVNAQILRGNALAGLKDFDGAIAEYESAIAIDPKKLDAFVSLGTIQFMNKQGAEAEAAFLKAVEADPKSSVARLALANYYWASRRPADAETTLKAAIEIDPKNVDANRALGIFLLSAGRAPEAEPYFKALTAANPTPESLATLAAYYVSTQRLDAARQVLTDLSQMKDGEATAVVRLAALDSLQGQRAAALNRLREFLVKAPKNLDAQVLYADLSLRDHKRDDAQTAVNAALAIDPASARAHELNAQLLAETDRTTDAIKEYEKALSLNPRPIESAIALSKLHLSTGNTDKALAYAQQALAINPGQPDAQSLLVRAYLSQGELSKAKDAVADLQKTYPTAPGLYVLNALVQIAEKNIPAARASYLRALDIEPGYLEALDGAVRIDVATGRQADAVARLDAALKRAEPTADLLMLAARGYVLTGKRDVAETLLKRAIDLDPARLTGYAMLGELFAREKRVAEAKTQYEGLLQRNPNSVPASTMLGMLHESQGEVAEAEKYYERVLALDPKAAVAANNLAWIYVASGRNLDQALQLAQAAKSSLPNDPSVNDTLGWIYVQKKLASLAIGPLEAAVREAPAEAAMQYHLGTAYLQNGDLDKAKRAFSAALSLKTDFDGADQARKALEGLG